MLHPPCSRTPDHRDDARVAALGVILLLAASGGCGARDVWNRQAVSGVVTLDRQSLGDGAILLEPWLTSSSGMAVGATIRRGSFAIARDQGPTPGSYRVRIYSSSGVQAPPGKGQSESMRRAMVERLPEVYNTRSDLRVDVSDGGPNRFRFDLHGDAGSLTGPPPG